MVLTQCIGGAHLNWSRGPTVEIHPLGTLTPVHVAKWNVWMLMFTSRKLREMKRNPQSNKYPNSFV